MAVVRYLWVAVTLVLGVALWGAAHDLGFWQIARLAGLAALALQALVLLIIAVLALRHAGGTTDRRKARPAKLGARLDDYLVILPK